MPRKDFQRDLAQASVPGLFAHLNDVRPGDEDDTSEYPKNHTYFAFAATDTIPEAVSTALERFQPSDICSSVQGFLENISSCLDDAVLGLPSTTDLEDDVDIPSPLLSDDGMDWESEGDDLYGPVKDHLAMLAEMRVDLRAVKAAGYKVGHLGHLSEAVILAVSCRIGKLGISYEAMKAWDIRPSEYLVLLIRYPQGYTHFDSIISKVKSGVNPPFQMHVGVCDSYKPSLDCAWMIFDSTAQNIATVDTAHRSAGPELRPLFISKSLCSLLNNHFAQLLVYRLEHGYSWTGAELYLNTNQGKISDAQESQEPAYLVPDNWDPSAPAFLQADHFFDAGMISSRLSFPPLAMQFTLRRLVKCVEFCLNCYCKIESGFEALKPYVCSKGLCLYQYMRLGMGPSLEWEILSQPYVVDMLISFAYARASSGQLTDFPSGLGLQVPSIGTGKEKAKAYPAKLNTTRMELQVTGPMSLKPGDWILFTERTKTGEISGHAQWHCRVMSNVFSPFYQISTPIGSPNANPLIGSPEVQFTVYNTDFDNLDDKQKRATILMLLDTLPNVDCMRSYMTSQWAGRSERSLSTWTEKISSAALYVLRWIVASNRSCIMYDENPEHQVAGVGGYMQFRLAQGAPDKEQRFVQAVKSTSSRLKLQYPTLFAWHGSALHNWHSILREGLHFKYVAHGRACGDVNAPAEFVTASTCYVVKQLEWIQPRYLFIQCKDPKVKQANVKPSSIYHQDPRYVAYGPSQKPIVIPLSALSSRGGQNPEMGTASKSHKQQTNRKSKSICTSDDGGDNDANSITTLAEDDMLLNSDGEDGDLRCLDAKGIGGHARTDYLTQTDYRPGKLQESSLKLLGPPQYATTQATKALQQHLRATLKVQNNAPLHELGWYIDPNLISNIYQWIVEMHSFDSDSPLAWDLKKAKMTSVVLEIRFPPQFPMSPPFVRVIRPRFVLFSNGGGGHITAGGAVCMELLTNSGWSPVTSIERVLLQVRIAITSTDPRPARLERSQKTDYSVGEAVDAYVRVCQFHGWQVPADLCQVSWS
ncbi:hypothetical protein EYZ11_011507 [Aspergillus tanneri]|uniref:UBC core domain-containing protein n=1 Tax=Aspergillus tanneri TaxID=1220188 RepID=A0A4S3J2N7_9EURO|nr:hypothetical protein EYZ11_011507 [Aspergillus tanneri]